MNPLKKLAGQTAIYGLSTILGRFLNYLLTPLYTYTFTDTRDFGVNTQIFSYISLLNILLTYGMETSFFNFVSKSDQKQTVYSTALISLLFSTFSFVILAFVFRLPIADSMGYAQSPGFISWMIIIIATDALMAIPFARLRTENRAAKFTFVKLINIVSNIAFNVFFIVLCRNAYLEWQNGGTETFLAGLYKPEIGIGYSFLSNVLANLVSLLFLSKEFIGFPYTFNFKIWKEMIIYALPLIVVGLAGMVNETFDRIILGKLLSPEVGLAETGIYGACYKLSIIMTIFIQAFRFAAEPFFFNTAAKDDSKKMNAIVMKYFIIFCSFIFLGTMMNISWLKYFISEPYWGGLHVVPVLLLANLFLGIYYNLSVWYKLTGQTRIGAVITVVGAIITLVINFTFIPLYSYTASAWATFASYGTMMILSYYLGQKYYPIKYNMRSFVFFAGFAVLFYFISRIYVDKFSFSIELILNNILVLAYAWIFYKFEVPNFKILSSTGSSSVNNKTEIKNNSN